MKRRDWALLALSASPDGSLAPVQMQKAMFLLAENVQPATTDSFYSFKPYHYGPFDQNVYRDLDRLIDEGLVRRVKSRRYSGTDFEITELGKAETARLAKSHAGITRYLTSLVHWMRPLSFSQLVSAIYKNYPKYRKKSIFRG
jgi:uncharacterized protein YwgA